VKQATEGKRTGSVHRERSSAHSISISKRYLIIFSLISGRLLWKTLVVAGT